MFKKFLQYLGICILIGFVGGHAALAQPKPHPIDRIVAVVNDDIITEQQLAHRLTEFKQQAAAQGRSLPKEQVLRRQLLKRMIEQKLQLQLAQRNHIAVTQDQLNAQIQKIAKENHMTLSQFKNALEQQGLNYAQYRRRLRDQMTIQLLQREAIAPKIHITKQQVDGLLKNYQNQPHADSQFHVADIVVPLPDSPTPQAIAKAKQKAQTLLKRLKQGHNFNQLAMGESSGQNALQGGDLGWRRLAELPDAFTQHLVTMTQGDVAGPIRAPNGFHLIKLKGLRSAKQDLSPKKAREMLFQREFEQQHQAWLRNLKQQAYIKIE